MGELQLNLFEEKMSLFGEYFSLDGVSCIYGFNLWPKGHVTIYFLCMGLYSHAYILQRVYDSS